MAKASIRHTFDKAFYDRFYFRPTTAVVTVDETRRLARFVLSYLDYLGVPVKSVLDAGCGVGLWQQCLTKLDDRIAYTGIDSSAYLCDKFGWIRSSIADFAPRGVFDLVICQDVLQYVDDDEVRQSIEAIDRLCTGALYLDVPTKEDVAAGRLDLERTDDKIHLRSVGWYRRLVDRRFVSAGGGLFLAKHLENVLLGLERG